MDKRSHPTVYVIAGPNGAGKTTFSRVYLPRFAHCPEFLNADLIAAGLSPFAPHTQDVRAGRLLLERMKELAAQRATFGIETTLSGRSYFKILGKMKSDGYRVVVFFLWLPEAEFAVKRVANRARQGGHSVPPDDIRRRYASGIRNLFHLYRPLIDRLRIYDATQMPLRLVASEARGQLSIRRNDLYRELKMRAESVNENAE